MTKVPSSKEIVNSLCLLGGGGSFSWPGIDVVVYVMSLPAGGGKALGNGTVIGIVSGLP